MVANVEDMFSVREKPWHGLGKVIEEAPTSEEALIVAGLNWEVQQRQVYVGDKLAHGYRANVRSDNSEVLGIVSQRYTIVQNREAFSFTDKLINEGEVRYETAGSLKNGRQVWMLARLNKEVDILGDKVDPYLCFVNSHDGLGAVKVLMTPIRVVCQNTLNLALQNASRSWSTMHKGSLETKLIEAQHTLGLAVEYVEQLGETAEQLSQIKVSDADWTALVSELIPMSEKASERKMRNVREQQTLLYNRILEEDVEKFRNTGWGVINAVTDFVAHTKPARLTNNYRENLFGRVVQGDKLVDEAFKLLVA